MVQNVELMDQISLKSLQKNQTNSRNTEEKYFNAMYLTVILMPSCCTDERLSFFTFASSAKNKSKYKYKYVKSLHYNDDFNWKWDEGNIFTYFNAKSRTLFVSEVLSVISAKIITGNYIQLNRLLFLKDVWKQKAIMCMFLMVTTSLQHNQNRQLARALLLDTSILSITSSLWQVKKTKL